ncbi:TetR/AcrR family transcriptional regulator [Sciscionella sediminilitoris]|uniref:TetR/AcrR family transcriptional regulator n=1 Tax=Sciscionella sediminilitoris TaxID=1445613 RepID=UPI000561175C|nr:TetR/AcrR family transcriptional regulator [Sciscionella sp. SE31]
MRESARGEEPGKTRRRGPELVAAIHRAVLAELAEHGFRGLTMDGIGTRAGTGRAPLYRRWKSVEELVLDTVTHALTELDRPADTGDLRTDLLAHFRRLADGVLAGELGGALHAIIGERARYPELIGAIRDQALRPHLDAISATVRAAAQRGELDEATVTEQACAAGPALIVVHSLIGDAPPGEDELADIVDHVVLPSLGYRKDQRR